MDAAAEPMTTNKKKVKKVCCWVCNQLLKDDQLQVNGRHARPSDCDWPNENVNQNEPDYDHD